MYYYLNNEDYKAVGVGKAGSGFYFASKLVAWQNNLQRVNLDLILGQRSCLEEFNDAQTTQSFTPSLSSPKEVTAHSQCPPSSGPVHSLGVEREN